MISFESACVYAHERFQAENNGLGTVEECSKFWLFNRARGGKALIIYKDGSAPQDLTLQLQVELYPYLKACRVIHR